MDSPVADYVLSAIAGVLLWTLIRRIITPTPSLEARVERLETSFSSAISELRAARDRSTARLDIIASDRIDDGRRDISVAASIHHSATVRPELHDQFAHCPSHPIDRCLQTANPVGKSRMTNHADQRDPE
jgi:hypothetical protein